MDLLKHALGSMPITRIFIGAPRRRAVKIVLLLVAVAAATQSAWALEVELDKNQYTYLDRLSFTVKINELTGNRAEFWIIDSSGRQSSSIPLAIQGLETVSVAPSPFNPSIYPQDTYTVRVEYAGESAEATFELVDTGAVAVPPYLGYMVSLWAQGAVEDDQLIKVLSDARVVPSVQDPQIPQWCRQTAQWASQGFLTMDEFAASLRYLIEIGVVGDT